MSGLRQRTVIFGVVVAILAAMGVVAAPIAGAVGVHNPLGPSDSKQQDRNDIYIGAKNEFNPSNGVRYGQGTRKNPFVISGWNVQNLSIHDTNSFVLIKDNRITGELILNWIGQHRVKVVNNTINDLRVNENVERTGEDTSGLIAHNKFGVVGQLRHWNGRFVHNTVGSPDSMQMPFSNDEAVNFDGFDDAHFAHNVIYGYVDCKLHGHHFSSGGFGKRMTDNLYNPEGDDAAHAWDPMAMPGFKQRYDRVWITDNTIYSSGPFALRYNDLNHAGDDRTASSEPNPALEQMHVHHTKVYLHNNKLFGTGLQIEIFNSEDEHHIRLAPGLVSIKGNEISLSRDAMKDATNWGWGEIDGIYVHEAQALKLDIAGNKISETPAETDKILQSNAQDTGIYLGSLNRGRVYIRNNDVSSVPFGIRASDMSKSVWWWVKGLQTKGVDNRVYYDNSVMRHPNARHHTAKKGH